jgi:outer membrane protein
MLMNRFLFVCTLAAAPLCAQITDPLSPLAFTVDRSNLLETPSFTSPKTWFKHHIQPDFPKIQLQGPTRLTDHQVDGKLELSLKSYLELVLMNNTDILIQKLGVEPQRNAITRAFSPFDPNVTTSFRSTRSTQLPTSSVAGGNTVTQLSQPFSLAYDQTLDSGTQFNLTYNFQKVATNSNNATFNPSLTSTMQMSFTQPLMRNRGRANQLIPVLIAQTRFRSSELNAEDQIQRLVQTAELAYWAVVEAREALKVQETSLATQDQFLKRSQRELELGAISPLDIYQPQQTYATQEVQVTQARFRLVQAEDALRRQMGADLDPAFRDTPIVLTETVLPPSDDSAFDREGLVNTAYNKRPDLKSLGNNLTVDELNARTARNSLLPDVSLTGQFSGTGRGGTELLRSGLVGGTTIPNPVGISPALTNTFGFNFPTYGGGLTIRFPVRDRRASADLADATVNKRLDTLRIRQSQQNIRQEVLNAVTQVESSRASVKLAQVAMDFSQKRLEAEQKKYDLGVTTIFFLLDAQTQLTNAQANVVTQSVQYRRNLLTLLRVTGQLLEERNIQVK